MKKEEFVAYQEQGVLSIPIVLLRNYHKLGLTEQEFTLILLVHSYMQNGNYFPTPMELSEHMSISSSTCANLLRHLIQRGFLYIEEFEQNSIMYEKYSLAPLWEKLYQLLQTSKKQEDSKVDEKNLYTIFEQEFGRPLSPFECETLSIWLDQDHHDPDIIMAALREAVLSGKLNFRYIDRILFEWKKNGIQTIDQARKHAKRFRSSQKRTNVEKTNKEYKRIVPFYNWLDGES
ncbi:DnaD domain-containing protein [Bacillus alveayuensis]|jgi:DNA replication protein|uniref:DNA replication protein n=1 Tax=Aeribacillus alveayuensis TaxID=279215 RepID=A0ABT9VKS6_9BACI|nr:DnaD domain-containing protein [Bacillus alveayuensis]MDQ0161572.1 DNA replication protein [Bacillus alveayuensis]